MKKAIKTILFSFLFISLGVVIRVKADNHPDINESVEHIQTIPIENVSAITMGESTYLVIGDGDTQKIFHEVNELTEEEENAIITNTKAFHNPNIGLTNQEFQQAIEMIEEEMEQKGYIKDHIHVENGFRGFLRDIVTKNFINKGDTIRTHYDKVDQLVDYMNSHYKRREKVQNNKSTITYTEFGKTDQIIQTITIESSEQLKKIIDAVKNK